MTNIQNGRKIAVRKLVREKNIRKKLQWKNKYPKPTGHSKSIVRGKFLAIEIYLKKWERFQIKNLTVHLKELEKEQSKHNGSRRKEIIKIKAEINRDQKNRTDRWN